MKSENIKISSGYALICILWGSTWLAIRIGLDSLTPMFAVGTRFLIASLFVLGLMKYKKIKLQTDALSIKLYILLALFSFSIPFALVYWAEQFIPSGLTSILFSIFPFFVILFSRVYLPNQRINPFQVIGVVLGFTGIYFISSENLTIDFSNDSLGMLAVFASAVIQAGIAVTIKKHGGKLNPISMNFPPLLLSGIIMTLFGLLFEESSNWQFDSKAIVSILYLAFFGTLLTFTTYFWLMKKINVVILSLSSFITPIISIFLGWLILSEEFSTIQLLGSSLVLIGILFANFKGLLKYFHRLEIQEK